MKLNNQKLLLRSHDMVERYGVTIAWLNDARHKGYGPKFIKIGKRVFYPLQETDEWFLGHGLRTSTSEASQ